MPRSRCQQFGHPRLPFSRMLCVAGMQVVFAAARVRVHEQQRFVLARQCAEDVEQQHMLVDVGEIASVILMAVLHALRRVKVATLYTLTAAWSRPTSTFSACSPPEVRNGFLRNMPRQDEPRPSGAAFDVVEE